MRNGHASTATNGKAHHWGVFQRCRTRRHRRNRGPARIRARAAWTIAARPSSASAGSARNRPRRWAARNWKKRKIGRLDHKIEKLKVIADRIPGVEFLKTEAFSGENGVSLQEYAPFGVIGVITPVTHSLPTLACNAINMLASGNAVGLQPASVSGARIACKGMRLFNQAIHEAIGIDNLITIIETPTLESAQAIFDHRGVGCCASPAAPRSAGRPCAARSGPSSPGPGNPPVVVDETADLDNAARSIVIGGAYDNNLLCIGEKEVFAVAAIFDELMEAMTRHKAVRLDARQIEALTKAAFVPSKTRTT